MLDVSITAADVRIGDVTTQVVNSVINWAKDRFIRKLKEDQGSVHLLLGGLGRPVFSRRTAIVGRACCERICQRNAAQLMRSHGREGHRLDE
jgi:hypothetical protein